MDLIWNMEDGSANSNEKIRSIDSTEKSFLMFVNGTSRNITIYWLDYNGTPKVFQRLRPRGAVEVNTFRSHAWTFRDAYNGERMKVLNQSVYVAEPYFMRHPRDPGVLVSARKVLTVHFPLRTLRENMLWHIVREMNCRSEETIEQYDLPRVLKDDLISIFKQVLAFRRSTGNLEFLMFYNN
ncbi:protein Vhl [Episyrphus balteatus]|uniref:protein Vhl n=1 Tax=Episyrphus balteatus TaxID=286459 RepID=UPI0024866B7E|nr:protein Vhl [Episyrphus balteatus]